MTDNAQRVQDAYDGFAKGDLGPLLTILADGVEWLEAEHSTYWPNGAFVGPQAVIDGVIARIPSDFEDFRIDITRLMDCGDTIVMEGRYRSSSARATGMPLDAQVVHVWDFRDDRVVRWQQYTDTWQFAQLTGVEHHVVPRG